MEKWLPSLKNEAYFNKEDNAAAQLLSCGILHRKPPIKSDNRIWLAPNLHPDLISGSLRIKVRKEMNGKGIGGVVALLRRFLQ